MTSRRVVGVGAGASGRPSCNEPVVLSCPKGDGVTSAASWSIAEGTRRLESAADPGDACDMGGPFVVGDYALEFPWRPRLIVGLAPTPQPA